MANLRNGFISRTDIATLADSEGLKFDDEDRISVLEAMQSIDVQACPGSGKTTLIAAKLILLAKKWPFSDRGICVLSHTNIAKDEIVERLKKSKTPEVQRLLSYPHFIGTFQEFAGKFLAFPQLRSVGIDIKCVDTDICVDLIYSTISQRTRSYIDRKNNFSNVLYDFSIEYGEGKLSIKVPTFNGESTSNSYKNLRAAKEKLIGDGHLFYRDVYVFAQMLLSKNPAALGALRKRFPCVFIDEMQDTQKFQDELINKIFPQGDPKVIIQRFGDPDQAIFHGVGNELPNESFNGKTADRMDFVIHNSYRFDEHLARIIKPLSCNGIPLGTELQDAVIAIRNQSHSREKNFEHHVIIFNDENKFEVLQTFANIVCEQFNEEYKNSNQFVVKALGAVGNEIDPEKDQLKIGHYWKYYDKSKTKNSFKENSLIEVVRYCHQSSSSDWSEGYKLLLNSILKLLRLSNKSDEGGRRFTSGSLQASLKISDSWDDFRQVLYNLLSNPKPITETGWSDISDRFKIWFDLQGMSEEASQYLSYTEETPSLQKQAEEIREEDDVSVTSLPNNVVRHPNGFHIHLSTIHGVKGETHDATLVMETKFNQHDVGSVLDYLACIDEKKISGIRKIKFARQLYVAMSRPRHLLCLAIHEDRVSEEQKTALESLGWNIRVLNAGEIE